MDIKAIVCHEKHTVILCRGIEFESVKSQLKAYLEKHNISHIFTGDNAFNESGGISTELQNSIAGCEYLIAIPKINWFANTGVIIRQLEDLTGAKVVAILPDFFNYGGGLCFNIVKYES